MREMADAEDLNAVTKAYEFARQFLSLSRRQQDTFLVHVTNAQCGILRNIVYNLLLNSSVQGLISTVDRTYLRRNTTALRSLASRRVCVPDKRAILVRKALLVKRVLIITVKYIDQSRIISQEADSPQPSDPQ